MSFEDLHLLGSILAENIDTISTILEDYQIGFEYHLPGLRRAIDSVRGIASLLLIAGPTLYHKEGPSDPLVHQQSKPLTPKLQPEPVTKSEPLSVLIPDENDSNVIILASSDSSDVRMKEMNLMNQSSSNPLQLHGILHRMNLCFKDL